MKKKILFIMESLRIGGAEKSLLTILNMLDYEKYDVDLFLFNYNGEFMKYLPEKVNLLPIDENYHIFEQNRKLSPIKFLSKIKIKQAFYSMKWLLGVIASRVLRKELYIGWNNIKYLFNTIDKEYDTSIAFLERKTIYFNVDKVKAKNKIGFIHNNYDIYPYDEYLDRKYFKSYNHIATVSEHCKDVLIKIFPKYKDKFLVIKNMVSKEMIQDMAKEEILGVSKEDGYTYIVSVGRLVNQKGFDIAIDNANEILKDGYKIKWYIVGEGEERKNLEQKIKKYQIEENVILVGADTNPYRWMNMADIYVQPSRFEGYGITVAEAMTLQKCMVVSNIPEFKEIVGEYATIVEENNYKDVIEEIISNNFKYKIKEIEFKDNDIKEIEKLYKIL